MLGDWSAWMNIFAQRRNPDGDRADRIEVHHPAAPEAGALSGADLAKLWGVTMRALRFYESRGLISPRREGRVRSYGQRDSERIGRILRAKKLGFTLTEIGQMIDVQDGEATSSGLGLTAQKCLQQIGHLEGQMKNLIEALTDLRRIHLELCRKAGSAATDNKSP
jgi:DNA-binding transcriptional MerR regulator